MHNKPRQRLKIRPKARVRGKGQMALLPACRVFNLGKVAVEAARPLFPEALLHGVQNGGIILLCPDGAQRPGVEVSKVDAGQRALVELAQREHLFERAELIDFPHGLGAQHNVGIARLVKGGAGAGQRFTGQGERLLLDIFPQEPLCKITRLPPIQSSAFAEASR